jgi:hypothetical protein
MGDLSGLYGLLGGGAFLAIIGTLLTTRSGRQKAFDDRIDKALEAADKENKELEDEVRFLGLENMRLRTLCIQQGIDPDTGTRLK